MLDSWLRDVCYYYRDMPTSARTEIRTFLNLDLKLNKDIFVHDQLSWGLIEAQKGDGPVLIVRKETLINLHDSHLDDSGGGDTSGGKYSSRAVRYNIKEGSTPRNGAGGNSNNNNKSGSNKNNSVNGGGGGGGGGGGSGGGSTGDGSSITEYDTKSTTPSVNRGIAIAALGGLIKHKKASSVA